MAMVHQNLSLVPDLTIWENIALGTGKGRCAGIPRQRQRGSRRRKRPGQRSESVCRRMNAWRTSPRTRNSSWRSPRRWPRTRASSSSTSRRPRWTSTRWTRCSRPSEELKKKGVAIIFISHRIWEVARICDRLVAFRNGETVGELDFATQPRDQSLIVPLITGAAVRTRVRTRQGRAGEADRGRGRDRRRPGGLAVSRFPTAG